jgi:hypothetical protein
LLLLATYILQCAHVAGWRCFTHMAVAMVVARTPARTGAILAILGSFTCGAPWR